LDEQHQEHRSDHVPEVNLLFFLHDGLLILISARLS
jgi:hypothetical protein